MRALWTSQSVLVGPLLAETLDDTSPAFRSAVSIALWVIWALTLLATLVPRPATLTLVRIVIPAALPVAVWAAVLADSPGWAAVAVAVTAVTTLVAFHPAVGAIFVDGASYGDERRFPLKPPALLLLAPIPAAWAVTVIGLTLGPMLMAAEQWLAGVILTVLGVPLGLFSARALHGLARRWLVFVPAGIVLHDAQVLADPILFRRQVIARIGPALADTGATDLTAAAAGLALEVELDGSAEIRRARTAEGEETDAFLVTPSLPGAVLGEAERRRFRVG